MIGFRNKSALPQARRQFPVSEVRFSVLTTGVGNSAGRFASLLGRFARALQAALYRLDTRARLSSLVQIGKIRRLGISKRGNKDPRRMILHGARSCVTHRD